MIRGFLGWYVPSRLVSGCRCCIPLFSLEGEFLCLGFGVGHYDIFVIFVGRFFCFGVFIATGEVAVIFGWVFGFHIWFLSPYWYCRSYRAPTWYHAASFGLVAIHKESLVTLVVKPREAARATICSNGIRSNFPSFNGSRFRACPGVSRAALFTRCSHSRLRRDFIELALPRGFIFVFLGVIPIIRDGFCLLSLSFQIPFVSFLRVVPLEECFYSSFSGILGLSRAEAKYFHSVGFCFFGIEVSRIEIGYVAYHVPWRICRQTPISQRSCSKFPRVETMSMNTSQLSRMRFLMVSPSIGFIWFLRPYLVRWIITIRNDMRDVVL